MRQSYVWKCLSLTAHILPKNKKKWVFGAWSGKLYAENTKVLFQYINENHKEIKPIWITGEKGIVDQVRSLGYLCYHQHSLAGIWHWLTAGACFITEGIYDIERTIGMGNQKVIQLWHGMGIKGVGLSCESVKHSNEKYIESKKLIYKSQHASWYWMSASRESKEKYSRSYLIPEDHMFITGQPKDDEFLKNTSNAYIDEIRGKYPNARIAVYLPTHRDFGKDMTIPEEMKLETLESVNKRLAEQNMVLIFKPHMHEFAIYAEYETSLSHIIFATDKKKFGDVYEFLPACDLMITDYSGIMFSYLASEKPIIYFPYDIEQYRKGSLGFYYDYEDITYGPICKTWDEVIDQMAVITAEEYAQQRARMQERFCPYRDGESCRRIYEQVCKLLDLKDREKAI